MAVIAALVIGVGCCPGRMTAKAAREGETAKDDAGSIQESYILDKAISSETDWDKAYEILGESVSSNSEMDLTILDPEGLKISGKNLEKAELSGDTDEKEEEPAGNGKRESKEGLVAKVLQMPQKLEVMIDPWEVDGKGQIYSERYMIQNTSEDVGVLTLSNLTCRPREGSGVSVRTDRDGIHEDERKSIYIEMLFGTGERIVLSEEEAEYKTELKPGEKVTLEFTGEVNEHVSGKWDNRDVAVGVVYSWKLKERMVDESGDAVDVNNVSGDVSGDMTEDAAKGVEDASGDVTAAEPDVSVQEPSDDSLKADQTESPEDGSTKEDESGKEELKAVDIDLSKEAEIHLDSWTSDGNGNLISCRYVACNTGNVPGILKLSDLMSKSVDESGTDVRMRMGGKTKPKNTSEPDGGEKPQSVTGSDGGGKAQDAKGMEYIGKECIWIELAAEEEGPPSAEQENQETSEYEAELEPGEEIIICFYVTFDDITMKELKDGKAEITAGYSWKLKEEAASES